MNYQEPTINKTYFSSKKKRFTAGIMALVFAFTYTISGLESGNEYGFAVRAYINGKWVTATADDVVYVTVS